MTEQPVVFSAPWGFSKLDVFRACPAKFKFQFIDKLAQESSLAMERGSKMHENIEMYLNGWIKELSNDVVGWKEGFDNLKKENFKGEQAIGLDSDWRLLSDWFHKQTWLRVKMDAYYVEKDDEIMRVIDFKSGKYREPSTDQVELYAIAGLSIVPTIKKVIAEFWFLDADEVYQKIYDAEELVKLRKKYEQEASKMYIERQWEPTPSRECRWCSYSKTKGGPCQY